jgi:hypothetical protein
MLGDVEEDEIGGTCSTGRGDGEVGKRNGRDHVGGIKMDEGRGNVEMNLTEIRLIVRLIMLEDTEIRFGYGISVHYLLWTTSIRNF